MAKIKLGNAPRNFKRKITIDLLDGTKGDVEFSFIYRTRSEYAVLMDKTLAAEAGAEVPKNETAAQAFERIGAGTVDFILSIADGWDLEEEFNAENVKTLIDTYPAITVAASENYRMAILEGRAKN